MGDSIFYLAKVKHNVLPIAFNAAQCSANYVRFENRQHDFPNVIAYTFESPWLTIDVRDNLGKGFQIRLVKQPATPAIKDL